MALSSFPFSSSSSLPTLDKFRTLGFHCYRERTSLAISADDKRFPSVFFNFKQWIWKFLSCTSSFLGGPLSIHLSDFLTKVCNKNTEETQVFKLRVRLFLLPRPSVPVPSSINFNPVCWCSSRIGKPLCPVQS